MPSYDELKKELVSMSELLKLFPAEVHEIVLEALIEEFLQRSPPPVAARVGDGVRNDSGEIRTGTRKKVATKESYRIVGDLNLAGGEGIPSFKELHNEKRPKSNWEFNTVAVYYLKQTLKLDKVTPDHVYTCYKEVSRKIPGAFRQSLYDASSQAGYIDTKDIDSISVTTRGENLVEHDLPRKTMGNEPTTSISSE